MSVRCNPVSVELVYHGAEGKSNVHSNRAYSRCAVHGSSIPSLLFSNSFYFTAFAADAVDGGGGVSFFSGGKIHGRQYVVHIKKHFQP